MGCDSPVHEVAANRMISLGIVHSRAVRLGVAYDVRVNVLAQVQVGHLRRERGREMTEFNGKSKLKWSMTNRTESLAYVIESAHAQYKKEAFSFPRSTCVRVWALNTALSPFPHHHIHTYLAGQKPFSELQVVEVLAEAPEDLRRANVYVTVQQVRAQGHRLVLAQHLKSRWIKKGQFD